MKPEKTLVLPEHVFADICEVVSRTAGENETGVALFGMTVEERSIVLAVAGPGPHATHEPAHYSADNDYTSDIFHALKSALPSLRWLGELHVHPQGMAWLSSGDRATVRKLLSSDVAQCLGLEAFIAGVMQRTKEGVGIYPSYFSRELADGCKMRILSVSPDHDLVCLARRLAAESCQGAPLDKTPFAPDPQASESPCRQGWSSRVVNVFRRKKHERQGKQRHDG